jgi:hypothetical protein
LFFQTTSGELSLIRIGASSISLTGVVGVARTVQRVHSGLLFDDLILSDVNDGLGDFVGFAKPGEDPITTLSEGFRRCSP